MAYLHHFNFLLNYFDQTFSYQAQAKLYSTSPYLSIILFHQFQIFKLILHLLKIYLQNFIIY